MPALARILLVAAALVAVADAVLHIAIGQPEPLRIAGNVVVLAATVGILSLPALRRPLVPVVAGALNLALNVVFVATFGIGTLGVVLIVVTTLLTAGAAVALRPRR